MRITIEHNDKDEQTIDTIVKNVTGKDYVIVSSHRHIFRDALSRLLNYETSITIDLV